MLSIRNGIALVATITFVACGDGIFDGANLLGFSEPTSDDTTAPRAYDRLCFEGYVRSAADDQPVSGASVAMIGDHTVNTRTEASGHYAINCARHHVGSGAYLRARKDGWSVHDIRGVRYSMEPQRYDFTLEPL